MSNDSEIRPEVQCSRCGGDGYETVTRDGIHRCDWCDGEGVKITEFGKDMLAFIKRHLPQILKEIEEENRDGSD